MAHQVDVVQPYQFYPESDAEGEVYWRNTDSAAAAGHFRMVSVTEYVT